MSYSPDDEPTGPLPVVPPRDTTADVHPSVADRLQWDTDGVDPRDPLGLGLPDAAGTAPAASPGHDVGREVGLDELWDQAVALTRDEDDADAAVAQPVVPPVDVAFLPPVAPATTAPPARVPPPPRAPVAETEPPTEDDREPAPLSSRWRAGIAAAVAVAAVTVAIVVAQFASSSTSPSSSQAGSGGPAFVVPTSQPARTGSADAAIATPPGLAALPPPAAKPSPTPTLPVDAPSVTVLNQTRVKGLAAKEADVIRAAGWTVRRVTNVNARQPSTTVYYDPSQQAAAKALIASVPSVKVALPRPRYLLRTGGLIVVVAADAA